MRGSKVLVTGGGGYIGRHVVRSLLARGADVVTTVRPGSTTQIDPRATVVPVDVLHSAFDPAVLGSDPFDVVVHLAWQDGFAHNAPSHLLLLSAHFEFLLKMVAANARRLTVLGTMHEVGYWEGAIDEETPTRPLSLYGVAKNALREAAFIDLARQVEVQWLRCFYIYGDDENNQSVFTRLLEAAARGDRSFPFTSGANRYDFIEVGTLGDQIAVSALTPDAVGIINCGTGEPVSLREKVEDFIAERDLDIHLDIGAFPDRPYDSPGVWGDASRIRALMSSAHEV